jgi:hypothetical protein
MDIGGEVRIIEWSASLYKGSIGLEKNNWLPRFFIF